MNNNINVSYYVNLEICDSENRNFFKKIEINLFRLPEEYYNKIRQNIMEGKKGNLYDVYNSNNDFYNNNKKNSINKNNKIKNLFSNIKNPLEADIKLDENNNNNDNNNIEHKNNINKNDEKINNEEARQKQSKKKISSLFNSDFD